MRQTVSDNGVIVKAYAGTTGVLLGIDIAPQKRTGLLGFALERSVAQGTNEWLSATLPFPHMQKKPGELIPTNLAPIQKFRWSDYRVYPETTYSYTVHPVYGDPEQPDIEVGPTVTVATASRFKDEHYVLFNRAAAASQAFSRKFPDLDKQLDTSRRGGHEPSLPPEALTWLSRGVLEQIVQFTELAADETWALDIAIYEYELKEITQAVEAAHDRGVKLRVVYHGKVGDKQTHENESSLVGLPATAKRARLTSNICHHKFIVLSRITGENRTPEAVLCGSTNFTHNGVYRQANVVHVIRRTDVAQQYLELFDVLFRGDDQPATRRYISNNNQITQNLSLFVGFSPRSGLKDLEAFVHEVNAAKRDVLFCTAFDLYDDLEDALLGEPHDPILRYGLENSRSQITGFHADRSADFVATAMLSKGLEGFLKESTKGQKGNILIHTKLIVIDFTSDSPTVISGSHNFSRNGSVNNDENFLVFHGNTDVADCYGCELMRLYDHYRFRFRAREGSTKSLVLNPDNSWTDPYFELNSLKMKDRLHFSGKEV